ncbi:Protease HtpX [uncultured archaeon]|nr:Protease HtpX [uncultured archaeon]
MATKQGSLQLTIWLTTALVFALIAGIFAVGMTIFEGSVSFVAAVAFSLVLLALQWYLGPVIVKWISSAKEIGEQQAPELHATVAALASDAGIPKPKLYVVDNQTPNAFAFGRTQKSAGIAIHTGLLRVLDKEETKAVLAHEIGHIKHNDVAVMTLASVLPVMLYYVALATLGRSDDDRPNPLAAFVGAIIAQTIGQLVVLWLSRQREYYADAHSAETMGDPMPLATALVKITYGIPKDVSVNPAMSTLYISSGGGVSQSIADAVASGDRETLLKAVESDKKGDGIFGALSTHPSTAKRLKALLS